MIGQFGALGHKVVVLRSSGGAPSRSASLHRHRGVVCRHVSTYMYDKSMLGSASHPRLTCLSERMTDGYRNRLQDVERNPAGAACIISPLSTSIAPASPGPEDRILSLALQPELFPWCSRESRYPRRKVGDSVYVWYQGEHASLMLEIRRGTASTTF